METFYGTSLAPGVVIASAACLSGPANGAMLSPERIYRLSERTRRLFGDPYEPEEAVLAGEHFHPAVMALIPQGLKIAAIALAYDLPLPPLKDCPTVVGLGPEFLASVTEDMLLIVDGDRGRVIVDPDGTTVALYQAPLLRRRPFHLEAVHLAAKTLTGARRIEVFACTPTLLSVEAAMAAGADGIVIPSNNQFLGGDSEPQTASEQEGIIVDLFERLAGLPILLDIPLETLALQALHGAAAAGPLHIGLRDPDLLSSLTAQAAMIGQAFDESEIAFGQLHFEAIRTANTLDSEQMDLNGYAGLWLSDPLWDLDLTLALPWIAYARRAALPVLVGLNDDSWPDHLPTAIGFGCDRVLVPSNAISEVKNMIRQL